MWIVVYCNGHWETKYTQFGRHNHRRDFDLRNYVRLTTDVRDMKWRKECCILLLTYFSVFVPHKYLEFHRIILGLITDTQQLLKVIHFQCRFIQSCSTKELSIQHIKTARPCRSTYGIQQIVLMWSCIAHRYSLSISQHFDVKSNRNMMERQQYGCDNSTSVSSIASVCVHV